MSVDMKGFRQGKQENLLLPCLAGGLTTTRTWRIGGDEASSSGLIEKMQLCEESSGKEA